MNLNKFKMQEYKDLEPEVESTKALDLKPEIDESERSVKAIISSKSEDRDNDILYPEGMDKKEYDTNPVVLWSHNYYQPPIAKAMWVNVDGKKVVSKAQFAEDSKSNDIFTLVKNGFLNATSVGFKRGTGKDDVVVEETGEFREVWGWKIPVTITHIKKWKLLEWSFVGIGANQDALVLRDLSTPEVKSLVVKSVEAFKDKEMQEAMLESYKTFKDEIDGIKTNVVTFNENMEDVKKSIDLLKNVGESITIPEDFKEEFKKEIDGLKKNLLGISGELESIKTAEAKLALKDYAKELAAGEIRKAMGNVDYLLNDNK